MGPASSSQGIFHIHARQVQEATQSFSRLASAVRNGTPVDLDRLRQDSESYWESFCGSYFQYRKRCPRCRVLLPDVCGSARFAGTAFLPLSRLGIVWGLGCAVLETALPW